MGFSGGCRSQNLLWRRREWGSNCSTSWKNIFQRVIKLEGMTDTFMALLFSSVEHRKRDEHWDRMYRLVPCGGFGLLEREMAAGMGFHLRMVSNCQRERKADGKARKGGWREFARLYSRKIFLGNFPRVPSKSVKPALLGEVLWPALMI